MKTSSTTCAKTCNHPGPCRTRAGLAAVLGQTGAANYLCWTAGNDRCGRKVKVVRP